jgi:tetratricopeptide (TPR) repeat protein
VKRTALVLATALAAGCSPALREPPSVASLASKPAPVTAPDVASLLREADLRWAKRPDVQAVKEAEALYLRAAELDESDVLGLIGATRTKAWLIEHQREARVRAETAVSAVQTAQWCGRRQPGLPACDYWLAVAVGLQAREVRITADDGLKIMVPALQRVIDKDPAYDDAGPHRVMAIVLVRAPGWPLGPGDIEAGLAHARQAVELRPEYPPNLFALAEALAANKDRDEARATYVKGKAIAAERREARDPDAPFWIVQADEALASLKP